MSAKLKVAGLIGVSILIASPAVAGFSDNLGGYHGLRNGVPASEALETNPYTHNGSDVTLEAKGHSMRIYYDKPKSSLFSAGIRRNTVLFEGTIFGHDVKGTAYLFSARCGPAPYQVQGRFDGDNLTLVVADPIRDPLTCAVTGYGKTSNSRLYFQEAFGEL
jgi:hypothetical protein